MMGDMTKNLSRREFTCQCGNCQYFAIDFMLVMAIQGACDHFSEKYKQPISVRITGGNRCPQRNTEAGGAPGSFHMMMCAADHKFFLKQSNHQIDADEVADYYEQKFFDSCGIGRYANRTHFDSRPNKARWDVRK